MSTFHCDNLIPEAISSNVDASTTYTSSGIPLSGTMALSFQVVCTNGAAGTLYIDGSNQPIPSRSNQLASNATQFWTNCSSQVLTANQQAILNYTLTDQITSMHNVRVRFVASAAGTVLVSINARRMTD